MPAARAANLTVYYLGETFRGHETEEVFGSRGHWLIVYGTCDPDGGGFFSDEGGCAPPWQVQSTHICERNPHLLAGPDRTEPFKGARIMAAGGGIDIYTGSTAVTVFGGDAEVLGTLTSADKEPLQALRPVTEKRVPRRLPPPAPGSLAGKGFCS